MAVDRPSPDRSCSRATSARLQWLAVDLRHGRHQGPSQAQDERWVELVDGAPAVRRLGPLRHGADRTGPGRLYVDGEPVTPAGLQVARCAVTSTARRSCYRRRRSRPRSRRRTCGYAGHRRFTDGRRRAPRASGRRHRGRHARPRWRAQVLRPRGGAKATRLADSRPSRSAAGHLGGAYVCCRLGAANLPAALAAAHRLGRGRAARCRCCSTPTAARTPSGCVARARTPICPRSGSPTRVSPCSSPTAAAPPAAGPSGSARCTATSPTPVLDDQVDGAARARGRATRTSTSTASASGAGPSAATSPRWPCCAGPTSSTPAIAGAPVTDWRAVRHPLHRALPRHPDERAATRYAANSLLADAAEAAAAR